jgi:hypothetical protein
MNEPFAAVLLEGGKSNSLGRAEEVVRIVLSDHSRLKELYDCLSEDDAWQRMRAADALEKVCRIHPEWIEPYIERLLDEYAGTTQPSIQWHMAQIFEQTKLTSEQEQRILDWVTARLEDPKVDWIVAANTMDTLVTFNKRGLVSSDETIRLVHRQLKHHSNSVVKRATKILANING